MIIAVTGANWGDEGKGKLVDVLAQEADIVVRFQGGHNAGHTVINDYGRFSLHLLPSGVLSPSVVNILGNGVALDIPSFIEELKSVTDQGVPTPTIYISDRTQIVMPYHVLFDKLEEERRGKAAFGSTKSGMAYFYSDKAAKIGFQIAELFDEEALAAKLDQILPIKNALLTNLYHAEPLVKEEVLKTLIEYREMVRPYVKDTVKYLAEANKEGKTILMEAQLGSLRDLDMGIYPYSTSSNTTASYAPVGSGLAHPCDKVYSVTKAYSSCVGAGPFVTELFGEVGEELRKRGGDKGEYGATTGRPRRVGWFDAVATRYGAMVQGATDIALTNIDVLSYLDEIPVCVQYKHKTNGKTYDYFPNTNLLWECEPVLVTLPGWKEDITKVTRYEDLPENCRKYVEYLEELIGVKISIVSNGPSRKQVMYR